MLKHFEVRRSLRFSICAFHGKIQGKEDEHNWAPRERAIVRVRGMLKGDVHERFMETFLQGLKNGFIDASLKTVRGRYIS
jgi:CLIP-associating protein 1/2